jgi:hypothetical protein
MGLLDNVINQVSGLIGNRQSAPAVGGHLDFMTIAKGTALYNTPALVIAALPAAGVKGLIWEYEVEAQAAYRWGFGSAALPAAVGYWQFCILDEGTAFQTGTVHLCYTNHARRGTVEIAAVHDKLLHGTDSTSLATAEQVDKNQMQALPEGGLQAHPGMVGQNSYLQIWYTPGTIVAGNDNAGFTIPVTVYP